MSSWVPSFVPTKKQTASLTNQIAKEHSAKRTLLFPFNNNFWHVSVCPIFYTPWYEKRWHYAYCSSKYHIGMNLKYCAQHSSYYAIVISFSSATIRNWSWRLRLSFALFSMKIKKGRPSNLERKWSRDQLNIFSCSHSWDTNIKDGPWKSCGATIW